MEVKTISLNEREARVLHALERSAAHWDAEIKNRNHAGRNEHERDLCLTARDQFQEIIRLIKDA